MVDDFAGAIFVFGEDADSDGTGLGTIDVAGDADFGETGFQNVSHERIIDWAAARGVVRTAVRIARVIIYGMAGPDFRRGILGVKFLEGFVADVVGAFVVFGRDFIGGVGRFGAQRRVGCGAEDFVEDVLRVGENRGRDPDFEFGKFGRKDEAGVEVFAIIGDFRSVERSSDGRESHAVCSFPKERGLRHFVGGSTKFVVNVCFRRQGVDKVHVAIVAVREAGAIFVFADWAEHSRVNFTRRAEVCKSSAH